MSAGFRWYTALQLAAAGYVLAKVVLAPVVGYVWGTPESRALKQYLRSVERR
jgi:hypothetical protein